MTQLRADLQQTTLPVFTQMAERRPNWSRRFLLCFSVEAPAQALALAGLGLGGAVLLVSDDRHGMRAANHAGAVDFQVDSLTEALRILKNELRKGTAVSVGLLGDPAEVRAGMLARGVQPDAVVQMAGDLMKEFLDRGAEPLPFVPGLDTAAIIVHQAETPAERKQQDASLLEELRHLPRPDFFQVMNRRWLAVAPRLFPRDRHRCLLSSNAAGFL